MSWAPIFTVAVTGWHRTQGPEAKCQLSGHLLYLLCRGTWWVIMTLDRDVTHFYGVLWFHRINSFCIIMLSFCSSRIIYKQALPALHWFLRLWFLTVALITLHLYENFWLDVSSVQYSPLTNYARHTAMCRLYWILLHQYF